MSSISALNYSANKETETAMCSVNVVARMESVHTTTGMEKAVDLQYCCMGKNKKQTLGYTFQSNGYKTR